MNADVRKLLRRGAIFSLPFLLYAGVIMTVDPFNLFRAEGPVSRELKYATAFKLNYALWKVVAFDREPVGHILLGDSRMMGLPEERVSAVTGAPVANLAYGGGSLQEAIDTFWHAAETTSLDRVTLGVGFNMYSAANDKNRVLEVERILQNRLLYFINLNVVDATGRILASLLTGRAPEIGRPDADREAFWRHQIDVVTRTYYRSWREPRAYRQELHRIADYCRTKGILFEIIIPPGHVDLQAAVAANGLTEEYEAFKRDLTRIARVYDFDTPNPYTDDAGNFSDPYHPTPLAKDEVIQGVWGAGSAYVRVLEPGDSTAAVSQPNGDS